MIGDGRDGPPGRRSTAPTPTRAARAGPSRRSPRRRSPCSTARLAHDAARRLAARVAREAGPDAMPGSDRAYLLALGPTARRPGASAWPAEFLGDEPDAALAHLLPRAAERQRVRLHRLRRAACRDCLTPRRSVPASAPSRLTGRSGRSCSGAGSRRSISGRKCGLLVGDDVLAGGERGVDDAIPALALDRGQFHGDRLPVGVGADVDRHVAALRRSGTPPAPRPGTASVPEKSAWLGLTPCQVMLRRIGRLGLLGGHVPPAADDLVGAACGRR